MISNSKIKGLIIAGGTGGHIIPGLGIYYAFLDSGSKNIMMEFLSSGRNRKFSEFDDTRLQVHFYDPPQISKSLFKLPWFIFKMLRALFQSWGILRKIKPQFLIAMGGYTTLPVLLVARLLGIPWYLCEQNAIPGKATRFFGKRSKRIFLNLPLESPYMDGFNPEYLELVGNPVKPALQKKILLQSKKKTRQKSGGLKQVLVLGGSQGALQLNQMCSELLLKAKKVDSPLADLKWQIQCGQNHLDYMSKLLPDNSFPHVSLFAYNPDIGQLMADSDLLISRSGAGVISEAALFALPMILVPYPWSSDDHQKANARYYTTRNAAWLLDTSESHSEPLAQLLGELLENPHLLSKASQNVYNLARPDAAQQITKSIISDFL